MIRIVAEASKPKQVSSLLEQYKAMYKDDADKISNLQSSLDLLQGMIPPSGQPILWQGVEAIGESLTQLNDLKSSSGGWRIFHSSDEKYEKAILPQQLIRSWFWDKGISSAKISSSLDKIYEAGSAIRDLTSVGPNCAAVYKVSINGADPKIVKDLYNNGIKGVGRYDQYGCYEKLLSVMLGGTYWPQDGSAGAGDILMNDKILIEVKSLDSGSILTTPKVPSHGMISFIRKIENDGRGFYAVFIDDQKVVKALLKGNNIDAALFESIFAYCETMGSIGKIVDLSETKVTIDDIEYTPVKKTGALRADDKKFQHNMITIRNRLLRS